MKSICIDARLWGIRHTGIGRYIENLLDNLSGESVSIIIPSDLAGEPKLQRFTRYYANHHPYSIASQFEMFWLLLKIRPALLHVTHFTIPVLWPGKIMVTIHDLIKHQSRGTNTTTRSPLFYWLKFLGYLFLVRLAVYRSVHIITPAEYWKKELMHYYHISSEKISVTYEGVDQAKFPFNPTSKPVPYVIYTGNVYPHKNLPVLLRAIKILNGQIKLIIVCSRSVFQAKIEKLVTELSISDLVSFKSNVSDTQLSQLLSNSLSFVTPSLIEGFGLPGLEAMSAGTPVIAARASCLPEIYSDAALYFDPTSPSDLAKQITQLIDKPALRDHLITSGQIQVNNYSWKKMSQETWEIYQKYTNL